MGKPRTKLGSGRTANALLRQCTVVLPPSIPVDINGTVGAGEVNLLGETGDGLSVTRHYQSEGFETANITLTLDVSVGAGQIEVTR